MSKRTKWLLTIGVIAALVVGWQVAAFANHQGPLGDASGFEDDDGDLKDDTPLFTADPPGDIDWNNFAQPTWTTPAPAPYRTTNVTDAAGWDFKGFEDAEKSNTDTAFKGGTKQADSCPVLKPGSSPNKDDFARVYFASKTLTASSDAAKVGNTILNLAFVRTALVGSDNTAPSTHLAFEFNQNQTVCTQPAGNHSTPTGGVVPRSTANGGDVLLLYDYEGGTDTPTIRIQRWTASGWSAPVPLTSGVAEAKVNVDFSVDDDLSPKANLESLGQKTFGEAGIDLTAAGVFPKAGTAGAGCVNFSHVSAASRSSGNSDDAQMMDIAGPGEISLNNCGSVKIIKQTSPRGLNQEFDFTSTMPATATDTQAAPETCASFSLNDNGNTTGTPGSILAADNSAGNTQTCTNVPTGQYTVTEPGETGFTLSDITCTTGGSDTGSTATINVTASSSVTCVFTNTQNRQTTLNTAQGYVPQDTATITGVNPSFDGSVNFKLIKGTFDPATETCASQPDATDTLVYEQTVANSALTGTGTSRTATTTNPGGDQLNTNTADGYTIVDGASEGSYYWKVFYDGAANGDPDVTSCNENSTVSPINNGSAVSNPTTP